MVADKDFNQFLLILWDKKSTLRFHSPAAKAWQVSRHTPTLVWSLTLSMMLFSSEKLPPNVLPWPLMFSNTDRMEGKRKKRHYQFDRPIHIQYFLQPATTRDTRPLVWAAVVRSLSTAWASLLLFLFLQAFHCSVFLSHQRHLGFRVKRTVVCAMNHKWCNTGVKSAVSSAKLKVTVCINTKVSLRSSGLYEMMTRHFPPLDIWY